MADIVYYITAHGFGHATRAIEVINHIPKEFSVEIVTAVPEWLFQHSLTRPFYYHYLQHDPGIIQVHSLKQDEKATLQSWQQLLDDYPDMAWAEAKRIQENGARLAVGDISPFAIKVSKQAGIPNVIVANFSWDWICQAFVSEEPQFEDIIHRFEEIYRQCHCLLRTPLSGEMRVFPNIVDIPLIVRHAKKSREMVREELNVPNHQPLVLISFGGHGFDQIKDQDLTRYKDLTFLTFDDRFAHLDNARILDGKTIYHPDYLNASDLVLAKLGYGIVTECIAHHKPIAYPPRHGFPEYQVMEEGIRKYTHTIALDEKDFFQGKWDAISEFLSSPPANNHLEEARTDGGPIAAGLLAERAGL